MGWWLWCLTAVGVLVWLGGSALCHRWSLEREEDAASWAACLAFWPVGLMALYNEKPLRPKLLAIERSLQMEREAGLRFDGIFLLPGYYDEGGNRIGEPLFVDGTRVA